MLGTQHLSPDLKIEFKRVEELLALRAKRLASSHIPSPLDEPLVNVLATQTNHDRHESGLIFMRNLEIRAQVLVSRRTKALRFRTLQIWKDAIRQNALLRIANSFRHQRILAWKKWAISSWLKWLIAQVHAAKVIQRAWRTRSTTRRRHLESVACNDLSQRLSHSQRSRIFFTWLKRARFVRRWRRRTQLLCRPINRAGAIASVKQMDGPVAAADFFFKLKLQRRVMLGFSWSMLSSNDST